jgi:hypothetical protein
MGMVDEEGIEPSDRAYLARPAYKAVPRTSDPVRRNYFTESFSNQLATHMIRFRTTFSRNMARRSGSCTAKEHAIHAIARDSQSTCFFIVVEPGAGIEPAFPLYKGGVLPLNEPGAKSLPQAL